MKLKTVSLGLFAAVLLALMANFAFLVLIRAAYASSAQLTAQREQTLRAVEQLQRETELLSRLVRSYTTTGDTNYLLTYYDVYAVRQGEKPAPADVDASVYWDDVIARRRPHVLPPNGQRLPLVDRMKALNVSADELVSLQHVIDAAERLKKTEQIAFAATQGLYDAQRKVFVSEGQPDLAYATKLVHSKLYEQDGADLTRALAQLAHHVDARTESAVQGASARVSRFIAMAMGVDFGLLPLMAIALWVVRRRVLQPIAVLSKKANLFASGDYSRRGAGSDTIAVYEVSTLHKTLDAMAQAIEDDLAAREQARLDLQAARDQAEAATRAKSQFLANMSHEIRTPMNAIMGMTHLALQTPLTAQQKDYMDKVLSASQILLGLINDILDFSKIEAGRLTLECAPYRVEEVVGNAMLLVRQKAQEKEIELLVEFSNPVLLADAAVVEGDALRVGQILTNLLSNAVKFTHHGYVKLRVGLDQVSERSGILRFDIIDTGIGLTAEQSGRLFQEFTQADDSTTRRYGGTGLGLSISRRLAELMGGSITLVSQYGSGSTFTVSLPVNIANEVAASDVSLIARASIEHLRVLVVDDQSETRSSLSGLLRAMGLGKDERSRVATADSGAQALAMAREADAAGASFDLVLLDWVLPDMTGAEVTEKLRRDHPGLGVIVISAYGWDSLQTSAAQAGADTFLAKPILPVALRGLIGRITGLEPPGKTETKLAEPVVRLDGLRILLVEDNALNQQLAIELLTRRGAIVKAINNGSEAVEHLRMSGPSAYDVVLMDLHMPVMDGYEATRVIRDDARFNTLPIVAMTAHALSEERDRCLSIGMQDHISKPLEPQKVYATLLRYLPSAALAAPNAVISRPTSLAPAAALPKVDGLDVDEGLKMMEGDEALYLRVLGGFVEHLDTACESLPGHVKALNWPTLERELHTLRGLCGTVGALRLGQLTSAMEAAIKRRDASGVLEVAPVFLNVAEQLRSRLRDHLRAQAGEVDAPQSAAVRQEVWDALKRLLQDSDSGAIDLWRQERSVFKVLPPLVFSRLSATIEACDFDAALRLLCESEVQHADG